MGRPKWTSAAADALLAAWEAAVPPPRARELSTAELKAVVGLLRASPGQPRVSTASVQLKLRQVVSTYQFVTAFDARSQRLGNAVSWFDLPIADRDKCTVGLPASRAVMKLVSRDFFQQIARLCSDGDTTGSGDAQAALDGPSYTDANTEDSKRGTNAGSARVASGAAQAPSRPGDQAAGVGSDGSFCRVRARSTAFVETGSTPRSSQEIHSRRARLVPNEWGVHCRITNLNPEAETSERTAEYDEPSRRTDTTPPTHLSELRDHNANHDGPTEPGSPFPGPGRDWSKSDFLRFLRSWSEAVDAFLTYGNVEDEIVKLPSWLIRQRWMLHGGSSKLTVDSITDMKRCLIMAFQAVCICLSELLDKGEDTEVSSSWFSLPSDKRLQRIRESGAPEAAQRLANKLDEGIFNQIAAILNREAVLSMVTEPQERADDSPLSLQGAASGRAELADQALSPPSPPTAQPVPIFHATNAVEPQVQFQGTTRTGVEQRQASRKRSLSPHRRGRLSNSSPRKIPSASAPDVDRLLHYEPARARYRAQIKPTADGFADQDGEGAVQAFLDNSQRGFGQLVRSLKTERIRKRRVGYTFVLDTLRQRCSTQTDNARAVYLRELALLQSQQLFVSCMALHREREREREQRHCVVRRAVRWSLASGGHSLAQQQHLENEAGPDASYWRSLRR